MSKSVWMWLAIGALATMQVFADDEDPPGRAARLGFIEGTVSLQPAGLDDWVAAELNRPLTTGDRLWTQDDSRAEISLGSSRLRLNHRTAAALVNLDDHIAQIEISTGIVTISVRDLTNGEAIEVDTPQLAFTVLRPGKYRLEVNEQGDTTLVTVVNGEGEATSAGQAYTVLPNERARLSGDPAVYSKELTPAPDSFDDWSATRDKREDASISAKYVAPDVPGLEDLDDNGIWRANPQYGEMWMPTGVPDDWAPYRSGHWDWIDPWGWTWIDDLPWGYAPFHYGRWVFVSGGWGWIPGPFGGPAIFAPALVAWIGGDGFVFGGELAVGWVPLGPGELFIPGYHASARYFEVVNARNTVASRLQIRNTYSNVYLNHNNTRSSYLNEHARGGTTVVPRGVMTGGKSVMKNNVSPSKGTLAFKEYQRNAPVAPRRESLAGGRASTLARPAAGVTNRTIMTKVAPPAGRPSFQQQEATLRAHPGQPADRGTLSTLRSGSSESHRTYQSATLKPPPPAPKPAAAPSSETLAGRGEQRSTGRTSYGSITKSPGRPAGATGPVSAPGSHPASSSLRPEGGQSSSPRLTGTAPETRTNTPEHREQPLVEHHQSPAAPEHRAAPVQEPRARPPVQEHRSAPPVQEEHHAAPSAPAPRPSAPAPVRTYTPPAHH